MNVKLKVLTAAILAGFVGSAAAAPIPGTPPPPVVPGGIIPGLSGAPKLSLPERGAYAAIEGVLQAVEGKIYATSCRAAAGVFGLTVFTDRHGEADDAAVLTSPGSTLAMDVEQDGTHRLLGTKYKVEGGGAISGTDIKNYKGWAAYDNKGGILIMHSNFDQYFATSNSFNDLSSKVIKDFRWVRGLPPRFIDYGLQSLAKFGYPQAKYWQTSRHVRSNGVEGLTLINKQRLYNANGNTPCSIVVKLAGFNDFDGFSQEGTLQVKTSAP